MLCKEEDCVEILFGFFEGKIMGILLVMFVCNVDYWLSVYFEMKDKFCFLYVDFMY